MIVLDEQRPDRSLRELRAATSPTQLLLLMAVTAIYVPLLIMGSDEAGVVSAVMLCLTAVFGLALCNRTATVLGDPALRRLGAIWLIKLGATFFLLYLGWIPEIEETAVRPWGVDYQRFYRDALFLIDNKWSAEGISVNYAGIIYYYAAIFAVFGKNAALPALVNSIVTLGACLYLIRTAYRIKGSVEPGDWTVGLILLVPELVWFDVVTSRETLMGALVIVSLITIGRYLSGVQPKPLGSVLLYVGLAVIGVAAVRTGMLVGIIGTVLLMVVFVAQRGRQTMMSRMLFLGLGAVAMVIAPTLAAMLGGYDFSFFDILTQAVDASSNQRIIDDEITWNENSIGMLLMPSGPIASLVLLPPRMLLYLVAPLPDIAVPWGELLSGSMLGWQKLCMLLTSILNLAVVPYVLAGLSTAWKTRARQSGAWMLQIAFWGTFAAIAGGNLVIHERYRVMATPLLYAAAWLGWRTSSRRTKNTASTLFYIVLACAAIGYLLYKMV